MQDALWIYAFSLGDAHAMGYEASEAAAYEAATQHRAAVLADAPNTLPTKTIIYRIILRPVSADVMAALLNGDLSVLPALIETMEPIGCVE